MFFVWLILGCRDHNTGIGDLLSCFELAVFNKSGIKKKKHIAVLWANTCNLLTSGRIGKEMLLNFCKYALLVLLLPAIMEGIISFVFAYCVFFLFICENAESLNAN